MMSEDRCRIGEPVFGKSDFAAGRHVQRRYWYGLIRYLVEKILALYSGLEQFSKGLNE